MHARILVSGRVQGVGFRPFVYHLAKELGAHGFVRNIGGQVEIVLEKALMPAFIAQLHAKKPAQASISHVECLDVEAICAQDFVIAPSLAPTLSLKDTLPLDVAICHLCLEDLHNPRSRFFHYPFIACAHCGPRFSLLHALPYDRAHTSMQNFTMCADCQQDYYNPKSRRFFAQSLSCPNCPISLSFYDHQGKHTQKPLERAIEAIKQNQVVAIKGIGGFALVCDGRNKQAVQSIRVLKCRPKKPLALMVRDIKVAHSLVHLNALELEALNSPAAPIVVAHKKSSLYDHVSPDLDSLGVILPYSALHHLLLSSFETLIFTSANLKGEPIITDLEALRTKLKVGGILDHDRTIVHAIDDSVLRCVGKHMAVVRLARGLAPLYLPTNTDAGIVGMGAQNKSSLCLLQDLGLVVPEMGSLESVESIENYQRTFDFYTQLYAQPKHIGTDKHPRYVSSQIGQEKALECQAKLTQIQHHEAHMHALLGEWELEHPLQEGMELLGLICDGMGLGENRELWGGEVFKACFKGFWQVERILSFESFGIMGAQNLIKDARSIGYALAYKHRLKGLLARFQESLGARTLALESMLEKKIHVYTTTSLGRLFDAMASFCGVGEFNTYEGQSAAQLESLARSVESLAFYPFAIKEGKIIYANMLKEAEQEILDQQCALVARKFHNTIAHIALELSQTYDLPMLFGGGVFVNRLLCESIATLFQQRTFFMPKLLSCNDGALAFGQAHLLANLQKKRTWTPNA